MEIGEIFKEYHNKKTVVYGLGVEAQKSIKALESGFNILGLLDGFREDGELYGYPIISLNEAVQKGTELIIVAARPGSCKAITRRIENVCRENSIILMDTRGKDLLEKTKVTYDFSDMSGITKTVLERKIQRADVVSFDLFDTLIMRQTLFADDVVEYTDSRLREKGIYIYNFCRRRLGSEKELSRNAAPTLIEIYDYMLSGFGVDDRADITAEQLADLEWSIDYDMIVPRKDVCDIFREAVSKGKTVYVVSDSYYSGMQLRQLLEKCGITEYVDIISSSDYKTGKMQELYKILRGLAGEGSVLHIGDDILSDIENARRHGFETCRLYSGRDLLDMVGYMGLSQYMKSLSGRLRIGMFTAVIFNSPFQFERNDGRIETTDAYDVGYLFCAPVICGFLLWFYKKIENGHFENIWLGARDGYLIKKMYAHLAALYKQEDQSVYFLTSRTAAIKAGVRDEEDIRYVDNMKFSGTLEECLRERFGINADKICGVDMSDWEDGLMQYKKSILEKSVEQHLNYHRYIEALDIRSGEIAFFDFVAKGTIQMYIQRLVDKRLKGFYFMQLEEEDMKESGLDIKSFYNKDEDVPRVVYDNYYILEILLTSPYPSIDSFDEYGIPVYSDETRKEADLRCISRAQEGIIDYFKTYLKICAENDRETNRELDGMMLGLIHEVKITDSDFLNLVVEDPFFNRMTRIIDIL